RSAIRVRQNRLGAMCLLRATEPIGDDLERFVPRDALETALALRSHADGRVEQTVRSVDAVAEFANLGADISAGCRILARAVDLDDPPFANGDIERAAIGTIERTRRLDDMFGRGVVGFADHRASSHASKYEADRRLASSLKCACTAVSITAPHCFILEF